MDTVRLETGLDVLRVTEPPFADWFYVHYQRSLIVRGQRPTVDPLTAKLEVHWHLSIFQAAHWWKQGVRQNDTLTSQRGANVIKPADRYMLAIWDVWKSLTWMPKK